MLRTQFNREDKRHKWKSGVQSGVQSGDMTEALSIEQLPLKEVSLRFPEGSVGPDSKGTGGLFDGNDEKSEPFSYLTRRDDYEPPIPEPPQQEIEQAARNGIDKNTGLTTQPKWLSVLKKRQSPWFFVRWALCNCFCNPRFTMTRAQWIWVSGYNNSLLPTFCFPDVCIVLCSSCI